MDNGQLRVIAIGGSAGAINGVREFCTTLTPDIPAAVCIVIHVGRRGRNLIAGLFDMQCALPVATAVDGELLKPGRAFVAPADRHLIVVEGTIRLGRGPRENLARPAIDPLFRSVGLSYGPRAIGVVLTGMLYDGAAGLADLKRCGGVTVVQDPADAVVPDMPLEALRASDVDYRVPLTLLGPLLTKLAHEPLGPAFEPPPDDIKLEVEIALGRPVGTEQTLGFADPAPLSCPSCGGVLAEVRRRSPLRFRCQVGHAFTAEALAEEQEGTVDEALRVALRIVEERAVLTRKMAEEARQTGHRLSAASFEKRAEESASQVEIIRQALRKAQG
jgi:two-component system, chemotaxis family, protein-glutamate methylesterase/glutaminase